MCNHLFHCFHLLLELLRYKLLANFLQLYHTALLIAVAKEYHKRDWVMQLHFGCLRNNSPKMFNQLGPDTGFDYPSGPAAAPMLPVKFYRTMAAIHWQR